MGKNKYVRLAKKVWHFIWEDDSMLSWIVNIILAFVLIKFIVYPGLGFLLGTNYPIVAVVSDSMEHKGNFDAWWDQSGNWYYERGISKEMFSDYSFRNGFNKGDIMVLNGRGSNKVNVGDVMVFISHKERPKPDPIIHRVMNIDTENGQFVFQTKGDNNGRMIDLCEANDCIDETDISESQLLGKAVIRIPFLGYIKIWAYELLQLIMGGVNVLS